MTQDNTMLIGPIGQHEDGGLWAFIIIRGVAGQEGAVTSDVVTASEPTLCELMREALVITCEGAEWLHDALAFDRMEHLAQAAYLRWPAYECLRAFLDVRAGDGGRA